VNWTGEETGGFVWAKFYNDQGTLVDTSFFLVNVSGPGREPFSTVSSEPEVVVVRSCEVSIYWSYLERCGPDTWPDEASVFVEGQDYSEPFALPIVPGPC
jgi:hypothetical protein